MEYKALYRKYRPQRFQDVVGQEHIIKTLENIVESRKISHAYLFSGPKGTGKTSVAKIFANVINCMHGEDVTKACSSCLRKINSSVDVIELDAASNNGVDEIRDLKEKIEQSPLESRYKVYIIDEVHMLTKNAFNALLKTLEEPPKHAIFILATTDAHKIPVTILSRVQRFNFRRMSEKEILNHLIWILKQEKISYELDALHSIARLSSGGMRDALSILEQATAFGNNQVSNEVILKNFGIVSFEECIQIVNNLVEKKLDYVIPRIHELSEEGIDPFQLILNLITVVKEWLIFNQTKNINILNNLTKEQIESIKIENLNQGIILSNEFYEIMVKIHKKEIPFELIQLGLIKLVNSINNFKEPVFTSQQNNVYPEIQKTVIFKEETISKKDKVYQNNNESKISDSKSFQLAENLASNIAIKPNIQKEELVEQQEEKESPINEKSKTKAVQYFNEVREIANLKPQKTVEVEIDVQKTFADSELKTITTTIDSINNQNLISQKMQLQKVNKELTSKDYLELGEENPIFQETKEINEKYDQEIQRTDEFILFDNELDGDKKDLDTDITANEIIESNPLLNTKEISLDYLSAIENEKDSEYLAKLFAKLFFDVQAWNRSKRWLYELKNVLSNLQISANSEFKAVLKILNGCEILGVHSNYIIIVAEESKIAELNKNKHSKTLQQFFKDVFGTYLHVFPITKDEKEIIANYMMKWKERGKDIILNFKGPDKLKLQNHDIDLAEQKAYEIFGPDIKIKR